MLAIGGGTVSAQAILVKPACYGTTGFYSCPHGIYYNRTKTKILAEYQPNLPQMFAGYSMKMWRIGVPKDNAWWVYTSEDWQDVENAKYKIGLNGSVWRWGVCFGSQLPGEICWY